MERIPQSVTIRVPLKAYLSSDHVSAATGKTIAVVISKNGAAFGNPSGGATNATEIANGWYYVDLSTTDTGTLGPLIVRGTSTGVDDVEIAHRTVDATNLGASNLDASVAAVKTQTDKLAFTVANQIDANVLDWKSSVAPAMTGDAFARLGAPAGASVSADVAAVKVDTAAVKTQTDKLTFTVANQVDSNVLDWKSATAPAMTGDAFARLGAPAGASVSADVAAVKADTATLTTGTITELSQAQPPTNPTLVQAVMLPYMALRNGLTTDASSKKLKNDAGTVICKKALSDDGTTYTEAKAVTGP